MGKNIHGGAGHKKFARKYASAPKNNNKLRVSEDEGELYAIVTKMLGNNMFHCYCIDGKTRLGHIRGKFTGRGKRDNMVEGGKWVLVGLREWDKPSSVKDKMQQCDLLEVYTDTDKHRLKESVSQNWSVLDSNDVSKTTLDTTDEDDVVFGTERDFERDRLLEEMKNTNMERIQFNESNEEEEVDVDDI